MSLRNELIKEKVLYYLLNSLRRDIIVYVTKYTPIVQYPLSLGKLITRRQRYRELMYNNKQLKRNNYFSLFEYPG